jgi:hypothetical protein
MTAPNIVNVTTITGKSAVVDLTTTSATAVVSHERCRHHGELLQRR